MHCAKYFTCTISLNPQDTPFRGRKWRLTEIKKPSSNAGSLTSEAKVLNHYALLHLTEIPLNVCVKSSFAYSLPTKSSQIINSSSFSSHKTQCTPRVFNTSSVEIKATFQPSQWVPGCLQWPCEAGIPIEGQRSYRICQVIRAKPKWLPKSFGLVKLLGIQRLTRVQVGILFLVLFLPPHIYFSFCLHHPIFLLRTTVGVGSVCMVGANVLHLFFQG